jgi:hypothetical protein
MVRQRRVIPATLVSIFLVAGCGGSDEPGATSSSSSGPTPSATSSTPTVAPLAALPARTIMKRAEAAIKAADTLRLNGTIVSEGRSISIDMRYGKNATAGSVTTGGAGVAIILIGKTIYTKPSEAFWRQQLPSEREAEAFIELVRGKWIKAPLTRMPSSASCSKTSHRRSRRPDPS